MDVGILTIGDELTTGIVRDINASFIARQIYDEGWRVVRMVSVGDEGAAIGEALNGLLGVSDAVVVTGGLGPTEDDRTTKAVADTLGLSLFTDEHVLELLKERFSRYRIKWTENNTKQARFPEGSSIIENPVGTASGFSIVRSGKTIAVLPGVPREVERMVPEGLLPLLRETSSSKGLCPASKTLKLFGLTESSIDEKIASLNLNLPGVSIGSYPHFPEIHLRITSRGRTSDEADENMHITEQKIIEELGSYIFGRDGETIESVVGELLIERKSTIVLAESCTGGLISDRITDVPGSSRYMERGYVVYSNRAKTELLGVPPAIIEKYGAVSEETARLMAEGARANAGADIAVAVTGIAGPSGGSAEKPVGTVFIAVADKGVTQCRKFVFGGTRRRTKELTAMCALELLRRSLTGKDIHGGR